MFVSAAPLTVAADYATELEKDAEGYYLINTLEEADSLLDTVMHTSGDIRWRAYSPITVVYPTSVQPVASVSVTVEVRMSEIVKRQAAAVYKR